MNRHVSSSGGHWKRPRVADAVARARWPDDGGAWPCPCSRRRPSHGAPLSCLTGRSAACRADSCRDAENEHPQGELLKRACTRFSMHVQRVATGVGHASTPAAGDDGPDARVPRRIRHTKRWCALCTVPGSQMESSEPMHVPMHECVHVSAYARLAQTCIYLCHSELPP